MYVSHIRIMDMVQRFARRMETQTSLTLFLVFRKENTLAPYLFIICLDYVLRTSIDLIKENDLTLKKARSRLYQAETITDTDYADDIAFFCTYNNSS